jgi:hypothetical protein
VNAIFYLTKGSKTVGPCTLDDVRNYLAYGSVSSNDLVKRAGESGWTPLRQLQELTQNEGEVTSVEVVAGRRRTARYRDYERVPDEHRGDRVLAKMIWGFLFFPPLLWQAAISIYQGRIFSRAKDEHGYLLTWSRRPEITVSVLMVVNFLIWWWGILWLCDHGSPLARDLLALTKTGLADLQDWLSRR